jgi:hypothetical protein
MPVHKHTTSVTASVDQSSGSGDRRSRHVYAVNVDWQHTSTRRQTPERRRTRNATINRLLADAQPENDALREIAK